MFLLITRILSSKPLVSQYSTVSMVRIGRWIGLSALLTAAAAKEMAVNEVAAKELYDSGYVHQSLMGKKKVCLV